MVDAAESVAGKFGLMPEWQNAFLFLIVYFLTISVFSKTYF